MIVFTSGKMMAIENKESGRGREIALPKLKGVDLLRKFCLHPSKSSRVKSALQNEPAGDAVSEISTRPPSTIRVREETKGKKRRPRDIYSKFLLSHPEDRPWRRGPKDLPLWNVKETLNNKAAMLTAKISSDFCEWYKTLGESELINEEKLAHLFAIRIAPYAPSQKTQPLTEKSGRAVFHLHSRRLREAGHFQRPVARAPPVEDAPAELISMSKIFGDILHLEITQSYCQFLKQNPEKVRPGFLVDKKCF